VVPNTALTHEDEHAVLPPSDPSLTPPPAPVASKSEPGSDKPPHEAATREPTPREPAPREFAAETDVDEIEGWRPQWWLEDPMKTQQHAIACAYATDTELAKARATAVDYARQRLTQFLGRAPGATEMKTDALRTPTGEYRAFVLIRSTLK